MRTHPAAVTLLVFGIALGFLWAGGCSDDNQSVAAPTPQSTSSGAVFVCYASAPSANSSLWSLNGGASGTENTSAAPIPRAGTLKNLFVAPTLAFGSGSVTVVVRKN